MTIRQLVQDTVNRLTPHYAAAEARAMAEIAIEHIKGWIRVDFAIHSDEEASEFVVSKMNEIVDKLLIDEPLQYILGVADFHGLELKVTPSTLIPRPETSQLVDMIADRVGDRPDLDVLDIGTGSGAIAISLARTLKFPNVEAIDVSDDALAVARQNAKTLKANVNFSRRDILTSQLPESAYDVIVSNPPYVTESERPTLDANVSLYEPESALFVPDSDPLLFYRRISSLAVDALRPGGLLAFEINSRFGKEMQSLVKSFGFDNVSVTKDFRGNDRFLFADKPADQ